MDSESLDEFFARAEDVLTNWVPERYGDAMTAIAPDDPDTEPGLAPAGGSFYEQRREQYTTTFSEVNPRVAYLESSRAYGRVSDVRRLWQQVCGDLAASAGVAPEHVSRMMISFPDLSSFLSPPRT